VQGAIASMCNIVQYSIAHMTMSRTATTVNVSRLALPFHLRVLLPYFAAAFALPALEFLFCEGIESSRREKGARQRQRGKK